MLLSLSQTGGGKVAVKRYPPPPVLCIKKSAGGGTFIISHLYTQEAPNRSSGLLLRPSILSAPHETNTSTSIGPSSFRITVLSISTSLCCTPVCLPSLSAAGHRTTILPILFPASLYYQPCLPRSPDYASRKCVTDKILFPLDRTSFCRFPIRCSLL